MYIYTFQIQTNKQTTNLFVSQKSSMIINLEILLYVLQKLNVNIYFFLFYYFFPERIEMFNDGGSYLLIAFACFVLLRVLMLDDVHN